VQLRCVENTFDGVGVTETKHKETFRTRLSHSDTHHERIEVQPSMTSERLHLAALLYYGEAPDEPTYGANIELHTEGYR